MRKTHTCPECEGHRFFVQKQFRAMDSEGCVIAVPAIPEPRRSGSPRGDNLGHLEAWTCVGCGLTRLYTVAEPSSFDERAKMFPDDYRIVDGSS